MINDMPRQLWKRFGALDVPPVQPPLNTYPIDFTRSLSVLRRVLALESVEARELARKAGLEKPVNVRNQIAQFEGRRATAYPDPLTGAEPWTIGVGHTGPEVHQGLTWSEDLIDQTLDADISRVVASLRARLAWFDHLTEPRQAVLIGMGFQMGISGLMQFVHMLGAVRDERWSAAAGEMLASAWAKQTPTRASRLARQMETGSWE